MRKYGIGLLALTGILASCGAEHSANGLQTPQSETSKTYLGTTVQIDPSILAGSQKLENLAAKQKGQNPNTLMKTERGDIEFFKREIIVKVTDAKTFSKFLKKYSGVVLSDGQIPKPKSNEVNQYNQLRAVPQGEWQLVQIESPVVSLETVVKKLNKAGLKGQVRFPDQESANLYYASLDARDEFGLVTETNYVMRPNASGNSDEHLVSPGVYSKPANDWWLNSSTGNTVRAWNELGVSGSDVSIAIIDTGFTPDDWELTAYNPFSGYGYRYVSQYDFSQNDYDVTSDSGGDINYNGVTWHGSGVASVALGAQNNKYGSSGVAPDASPMLFRLGRSGSNLLSYYDAGRAVDTAIAWGAKVINMSFTALTPGGAGVPNTYLGAALDRAEAAGVVSVAAMGNDSRWQDSTRYPWFLYPVPASWPSVISVGATNPDNRRSSYSNYGPATDIFAPAGEGATVSTYIRSGPTPKVSCYFTALRCRDDAAVYARPTFNGTSAAAPYVAGAVALIKQVRPQLNRSQIEYILRSTSRKNTPDADVNGAGVIDVYAAVAKALTY